MTDSSRRPQKDEARVRKVVDLYHSGSSLIQIERQTDIPKETVRTILHAAGVRMHHVRAIYHEPRLTLDHQVALLLGLHAGDGFLSDRWGISVSGADVNMGKLIVRLAKEVLGVEAYLDRRNSCYFAVRSGKRQVFDFFQRFGFVVGRKSATVGVPACVMESSDIEVSTGFLKGAFSSDGSFWFRGGWGQCRFEVSSVEFRDGFIAVAQKLGFHFRAYSYIHHGGHNKLRLHTAYLGTQSEVLRWMETVGSISDTHLARYRKWRQSLGSEVLSRRKERL